MQSSFLSREKLLEVAATCHEERKNWSYIYWPLDVTIHAQLTPKYFGWKPSVTQTAERSSPYAIASDLSIIMW